ncbi:MAG: hypothetical protein HY912_02450 [Desulfomonile tiedjei]|uniref:Uncharacterized protein n=1 Tax=Desulfomonile tiedjei TaxID=2358 RepID=A0A9D6UXP5_9BACT|nr:hypothetical protein [Desulfomonile tiedjei]
MSARSEEKKKKLVLQALLFGAVTTALYAAVFMHADLVQQLFSRGGYYAAFPIATVFVFSFFHGTFASNLWSVLGIEAVTKQAVKRPTLSAPRPAQRPRPRLRMNA